ncbi:Ccc1 family [Lophiotrema nucula]|uniref:Ccc1 family n=1 Tax=Lophiotrema nucula TaxID=690887 RepID=A0A6A5YW70_9PLEO|nr:Ccc1 family [Lophiotrema nucula]
MTFTPYPHKEHHTSNGAWVRDAIIGFADGLTVPFALTAGLSSIGSSHLVILGGLAELFAGSISMGLGAYLAALTEKNHYAVELLRERREVESVPSEEIEEIYDIFQPYGVSRGSVEPLVKELVRDKEAWVRFMMVFELGLQEPASSRLYLSALVMGLSYFFGGLVPMIPYFAIKDVTRALFVSIGITVVILLAFGYVKAIVTGTSKRGAVRGALETLVVGVLAAGASYGIVKGLEGIRPVDVGK